MQVYITIKCKVLCSVEDKSSTSNHIRQRQIQVLVLSRQYIYGISSEVITNYIKTILFSHLRDKNTGIFKE